MNQLSLFYQQPAPLCCPTIAEQTGWRREHPFQICQDVVVLAGIHTYSFDLHRPGFSDYVSSRTGIDLVRLTGNKLAGFFITAPWPDVEAWILSSQYFTYQDSGRPVAEAERPGLAMVWKIMRGKLQDCWEIYCSQEKRKFS